jgi:hypothetical protein
MIELAVGDYATGNQTGSIFPVGTKAWFACPDFWEDAVRF